MVMVRKTVTAILLLALLLLGYQPINAPMAAMASTMDMDMAQPCCPDCDEPAQSDGTPCGALAGCVLRCTLAPPSFTVPTIAMPVFFSRATASPLFDDLVTAPDGAIPPFRPPRPSILA
jgi:hypothetical protein